MHDSVPIGKAMYIYVLNRVLFHDSQCSVFLKKGYMVPRIKRLLVKLMQLQLNDGISVKQNKQLIKSQHVNLAEGLGCSPFKIKKKELQTMTYINL